MIRALFINMPTIAFLLLFHLNDNRLEAACIGVLLAWVVILFGPRQPAIVRGLNLHFALIVPLLFLLWLYGVSSVANWIEDWALATVVWAASVSVAYAVWRKELPILMGITAAMAFGWTLFLSNDQLLTIGVPVIVMSVAKRWLNRSDAGIHFLVMSMAVNVDETA